MQSAVGKALFVATVADSRTPTVHQAQGEFDGVGLHGIGEGNRSTFNQNEVTTVLSFSAVTWSDGSQDLLRNANVAFVLKNSKGIYTNMVTWSKLNEILRHGAALYQQYIGRIFDSEEDDAREDEDESSKKNPLTLRQVDNDGLSEEQASQETKHRVAVLTKAIKRMGGIVPNSSHIAFENSHPHRLMSDQDIEALLAEEMQELEDRKKLFPDVMSDKAVLGGYKINLKLDGAYKELLQIMVNVRDTTGRYAFVESVRRFVNLLGIVNNSNEGKGLQLNPGLYPSTANHQKPALVVNVAVDGRTRVFNLWGNDVNGYSRLHAVLTREKMSNGKWDVLQVVPWYSNIQGQGPPPALLWHRDYTGASAIGHPWYIGRVEHRNAGAADSGKRRQAAGLRAEHGVPPPSLPAAHQSMAHLDMLEIKFGREK